MFSKHKKNKYCSLDTAWALDIYIIFFDAATTDVQSSAVTILETIATVSCTFISGSTCRGCYVEFKGKNSTTYMMVKLRRQEGQNMVTEKFAINFDAEDVVEVLTFDWEGNDSFGNVGISAQIHVEAVHASTVPTVEALGPKKGLGRCQYYTSHTDI